MRIALPFDGSPCAQRAVDYVIGLGRDCDKRKIDVHLVNVREVIPTIADSFGRDAADVASQLADSARKTGSKLLARPAGLLDACC